MKRRIFKRPDGTIIDSRPSLKYQDIPNFEGCKFPEYTEGLPYVDVEDSEMPAEIDSQKGNYIEMFHFDGEVRKENIKYDNGWNVCLMPKFLIQAKHVDRLNKKLDEEFEKASPEAVQVIRLQREKEKVKTWNDKEVFEQAIKNLDDRVLGGEPDKPIVRQKLLNKIEELK